MRQILVAVIVAACIPSAAFAVLPSGALQSGSVVLNTATYDATVDFAVYNAPDYLANGATTGVAGSNPGAPNTAAGQFVYAYQLTAAKTNGTPPSTLEVFLAASHGVNGVGYDPGTGGDGLRVPLLGELIPDPAVQWTFLPELGLSGIETSKILVFTSPNAPVAGSITVIDGGVSANGAVLTPVPAPGAAVLGMLGLGIAGRLRRRRA